jgi:aminopeptidase N
MDLHMRTDTPQTIKLADYQPTPFRLKHVGLLIDVQPETTRIDSTLHFELRSTEAADLVLDGEGLSLLSIAIDGNALNAKDYDYRNHKLTIRNCPFTPFTLNISQTCNPKANTALSGLYLSNSVYCTQMEAEGFRRMAFCYDRPDVMATYDVRIEAATSLPVLLSNGNPGASGLIAGTDRHFAEWHDPHPKPTYLFAMVAGDLASVEDHFVTADQRRVKLGIYVERGKEDRCDWAMQCLKASMRWDEERFGLLYDLDIFNIVAVSDFNMGAMENKGLNVFNDKYVLAKPDTATDTDYVNIERIIAHEYFHNWTGNRVTCRDWFQLCLKEGLTVFRDQEFTADMRSRAVKRIEDVKTLRARQFPEDQGPLAHAVRPSSYIEINNFYTPTIYEKGAELCRMLHSLMGAEAFRTAIDLYFARHDGEAATVEDFLTCMADASGRDLKQFALWYEQAGTPVVTVSAAYDAGARRFRFAVKQHTPATPQQSEKQPLHIPLHYALYNDDGVQLLEDMLELRTFETQVDIENVAAAPHLSINRDFTAPIILRVNSGDDTLFKLMGCDTDPFNRWEAAQTLARGVFVAAYRGENIDDKAQRFAKALLQTLNDPSLDNAFKALMLQLPGEAEITAEIGADVDADQLHLARKAVLQKLAHVLALPLQQAIGATQSSDAYVPDTKGTANRALRYACLAMLGHGDGSAALAVAEQDFQQALHMTAQIGAIGAVLHFKDSRVDALLSAFYARHGVDHLLVDKWFLLKASRPGANIQTLTEHAKFTLTNPNRVYAVLGGFTGGNLTAFHAPDGTGYEIIADFVIRLNGINPQVAARAAGAFRSWRNYNAPRRAQARRHMQRILETKGLSNDVFEIITRTLGNQ